MITNRDDDYLICKHYYKHIDNVSKDYPGFITFEHNSNHFFAWVNDGKVILRSEAYPSHEKMERGIKAILKNKDIHQRYSIDSQHGAHFLVLWGGGDHQKHTGNMEKHNEIGRSCPTKSKEELYALMGFMGSDWVNKTFGLAGSKSSGATAKTAAAVTGAAAATALAAKSTAQGSKTKTAAAAGAASTSSASSGGFKLWWLLPLLLIPAFFLWKSCGADKPKAAVSAAKDKVEKAATEVKKEASVAADAAAAKLAETQAAAKRKAEEAAAKLQAEREAKAEADRKAAAAKQKLGKNGSATRVTRKGNKNSGF